MIDIFGCANSSGFVIAKCGAANVLFWFLFTRIDGIPVLIFFWGIAPTATFSWSVFYFFFYFFLLASM